MSSRLLRAVVVASVGAVLAAGVPGVAQASGVVSAIPSAALMARAGRGHITTIPLTGANGKRSAVALEGLSTADRGGVAPQNNGSGRAQVAVRSRALAAEEFVVAAVTWAAGEDLPDGATVQLRVLETGGWSDWLDAATEDGGPDTGEAASGTDPFITGGAAAVQVMVTGDPADLPADLALNLIPVDASAGEAVVAEPDEAAVVPSDEQVGASSGGVGTTARLVVPRVEVQGTAAGAPSVVGHDVDVELGAGAMPLAVSVPGVGAIVTRSEWGADEAYTTANWTPRYAPLQAAVVHHTAGTNTYTAAQSAGIVKAIFSYHTYTRGWGDIGYNFLVDKYGQVFEGRQNSIQSQGGAPTGWLIEAGHARGYNRGSLGISAMGDFTLSTAPDMSVVVSAMAKVIAWKFREANLDAGALSGFVAPTTRTRTTYAAGQELPRIFGHGDVASTSCPGGLYARLGDLLTLVQNGYTRAADIVPPIVSARQTSDGMMELSAVDAVDPTPEIFYTTDGSAIYWSPAYVADSDTPDTRYVEPVLLCSDLALSAVAVDDLGNTSNPLRQGFSTGGCPLSGTLYKAAYRAEIYTVTDGRARAISWSEWEAAGFPEPLPTPTDYVKYPWSATIYAVTFWSGEPASWQWDRLSFDSWQRAGYPEPRVAGWIAGSSYHKWGTSNEIFVLGEDGLNHKLSYEEWAASGFRGFANRSNEGWMKLSWAPEIARMTDIAGGYGYPTTFVEWSQYGLPTPEIRRRLPNDRFYQYVGDRNIYYSGPAMHRAITFSERAAAGYPTPTLSR